MALSVEPGTTFVGTALIGYHHNQVADQQRIGDLYQHGFGQLKAGVCVGLQTREIERDNRDEPVAVFDQRLAHQMDVVGRAAAAAGLRQDERDLVDIIFAGLDRIQQLADDQQRGVAGVVVHVAQALLRDIRPFGVQKLHVVAEVLHQAAHQAELHGQHVGHKDGVVLAHLFGKLRSL